MRCWPNRLEFYLHLSNRREEICDDVYLETSLSTSRGRFLSVLLEHLLDYYHGVDICRLNNVEVKWSERRGPYITTECCLFYLPIAPKRRYGVLKLIYIYNH